MCRWWCCDHVCAGGSVVSMYGAGGGGVIMYDACTGGSVVIMYMRVVVL